MKRKKEGNEKKKINSSTNKKNFTLFLRFGWRVLILRWRWLTVLWLRSVILWGGFTVYINIDRLLLIIWLLWMSLLLLYIYLVLRRMISLTWWIALSWIRRWKWTLLRSRKWGSLLLILWIYWFWFPVFFKKIKIERELVINS